MKKILSLVFVLSMVVAFAGTFSTTATAEQNFNIDGHVTICHQLGNGGYNQISPSAEGVVNGHDGHSGDIIPPFTYGDGQSYPGKNWDEAGQTIYNNNCKPAELPTTGTLIVDKVVVGGTKTASDFGFEINNGTVVPFNTNGENEVTENPGTYSVTEPGSLADGYTGALSGDCTNVTLAAGAVKTCTVTNTYTPPADPQELTATINATKIICPVESDLPNWGDHSGPDITSTTATDFITAHPDCHIAPWTFEWAPSTAANPGDNIQAAGGVWTPFSTGSVTIPVPTDGSGYVWMREQMPTGYIPFSGDVTSNTDNVSAEFYCHLDHLHYDNYERVDSIQANQTYNCVGFNVPTTLGGPECTTTDVSHVIVSDATNTNAVVVSNPNSGWATIPGSSWIWNQDPTSDAQAQLGDTQTFTKAFTISGAPLDSSITFASDNGYDIKVNGNEICNDAGEFNYGSTHTCDVPASDLGASNTISIAVTNLAKGPDSNGTLNPGGFIYALTVNENDCVTPPPTCTADQHLVDNQCVPNTPTCPIEGQTPTGPEDSCVCPAGQQLNQDSNECETIPVQPPACNEGEELVTNGDFTNGVDAGSFVTVNANDSTSIANWTVNSGSVDYVGSYWQASSPATRSIDLNGDTTGSVSQDLTTVSGQTYTVTFDMSGNPDGGPSNKVMTVTANGGSAENFSYDTSVHGNSLADMMWSHGSYSFTATGTTTTLMFASQIAGAYGPVIDNVSTTCTDASTTADLSVTKTVDHDTAYVDSQVTYTIDVHNTGPAEATGVTVSDVLPSGTTYFSDTGSGLYNSSTGVWTVGTIASGSDAILHITVTINAETEGDTISNTAVITHNDVTDPNNDNDSDSVSVTVNNDPCNNFPGPIPEGDVVNESGACVPGTPSDTTGSITVIKDTVGGDGTFDFTGNNTIGDFSITTSDGEGSHATFSNLAPADNYSITETSQDGWNSDGGVCSGDQTADSITLAAGQNITCTFTNTKISNGGGGGGGGGNNQPSTNSGGSSGGGGGSITPLGQVLGAQTSCGIYIDKFLRKGYKGNDKNAVEELQQFLDDNMNAGLPVNGNFGSKTEKALKAFQLAHRDTIMDPWGLTVPTGIFYLTTQTEVNNIMCPSLNLPIPNPLIPFSKHPDAPKP